MQLSLDVSVDSEAPDVGSELRLRSVSPGRVTAALKAPEHRVSVGIRRRSTNGDSGTAFRKARETFEGTHCHVSKKFTFKRKLVQYFAGQGHSKSRYNCCNYIST